MKHLLILLLIAAVLVLPNDSFAQQDEEEGFVVRMLKKWVKEEEPTITEETKPKEAIEKKTEEAKETEGPGGAIPVEIEEERPPIADLTEKEIVEKLVNLLDYHPDVLNFIPGLKSGEDEAGKPFYTYTTEGGVSKELIEVEKEKLIKLYGKVAGEVNRLNTEKIMRQLEQIRQAQQASRPPAQPPKAYTPPKIPAPPQQPPQVYTPPAPPATTTPPTTTTPPQTHQPPKVYQPPKR